MAVSVEPSSIAFGRRISIEQIEEGAALAPKFGSDGLIPVIVTDADDGTVLMLGHMSTEALRLTLETREAHYWSRSRQALWRKGATSGLVQSVVEVRVDDDQDAIWLRVNVQGSGASCHVGYRSCFYRSVSAEVDAARVPRLAFIEDHKLFDPRQVYGDAPNPTLI